MSAIMCVWGKKNYFCGANWPFKSKSPHLNQLPSFVIHPGELFVNFRLFSCMVIWHIFFKRPSKISGTHLSCTTGLILICLSDLVRCFHIRLMCCRQTDEPWPISWTNRLWESKANSGILVGLSFRERGPFSQMSKAVMVVFYLVELRTRKLIIIFQSIGLLLTACLFV